MKTNTKGFTLIELLVVIVIIGILAAGATTLYSGAQQKARDSVRKQDLNQLKAAAEFHYADESEYPDSTTLAADIAPYMAALPSDPTDDDGATGDTAFRYAYAAGDHETSNASNARYEFSANMEEDTTGETNDNGVVGNEANRYEVGNIGDLIDSVAATDAAGAIPAGQVDSATYANATGVLF